MIKWEGMIKRPNQYKFYLSLKPGSAYPSVLVWPHSPFNGLFLSFPELPVKISKPLADISVTQKLKATFECELSKPNANVKWFKVQHLIDCDILISDFSGREWEPLILLPGNMSLSLCSKALSIAVVLTFIYSPNLSLSGFYLLYLYIGLKVKLLYSCTECEHCCYRFAVLCFTLQQALFTQDLQPFWEMWYKRKPQFPLPVTIQFPFLKMSFWGSALTFYVPPLGLSWYLP